MSDSSIWKCINCGTLRNSGYACSVCHPMPVGPIPKIPSLPPLTEGTKYDNGKPRMDLLDSHALEQLAKVLTFGAQKYAAHNWRKGISKSRLIAAALRHIFAYLGGQDTDEETGLSHIAHAMCCCMFILGLEHRTDLDDRHAREKD